MEELNFKLRLKLFLKFVFNKIVKNKNLKNSILKFFGRDYELSQKKLQNLFSIKINKNYEGNNFIVSLTSFPKRIHTLKYTLHSIFTQNLKPRKVILSLSLEEFKDRVLPKEILEFEQYGLEILWNSNNLRQYNKIIPTMMKYNDEVIVTLDDDIYYPQNLLKGLFQSYLMNRNVIWCQRGRIIKIKNNEIETFSNWELIKKNNKNYQNNPSFNIFLEGVGGVLYPPNSLYKDVSDGLKYMSIAPKADDIWLWAMAILNGTKISIVKNNLMSNGNAMTISPDNTSLWLDNLISGNDKQIKNLLQFYPQILDILNEGKF